MDQLDVDREWHLLAGAIKGEPVRLEVLWPAALPHLERVLAAAAAPWRKEPFEVVHVNCHGQPGRVLLDDGHGGAALVSGEELGRVVGAHGVSLVILGACYSASARDSGRPTSALPAAGAGNPVGSVADALVRAGVKAVAGAADWVSDKLAADFAAQFLAMLARGKSVGEAFDSARAAMPQPEREKWLLVGDRSLALKLVEVEPGYVPPADPPGVQRCPYFLDRARELTEISRLLDSGPKAVIWLPGEPGLGKTVLAAEVARRNAWRFAGGVVWVAFDRSPPTLEAILQAAEQARLKVEGGGVEERARKLAALASTAGQAALFILDNLDTVLEADKAGDTEAARVLEWVKWVAPPGRVLITSRENPSLGAVQSPQEVGEFPLEARVELFWKAAGAPESGLDPEDPECGRLATDICTRLGGLPLAIELVGARAHDIDLQTLEDNLESELDAARLRGVPEKHRSLEAALSGSFKALANRLQAYDVLPILAAFPAGADPAMLDALLGKGSWRYGIAALTSLSIARTLHSGARNRWRLIPAVRHFALRQFEPAVIQRVRQKGVGYLAAHKKPEQGDAENAAAALAWLQDVTRPEGAFWFTQDVGERLYNRGWWNEATTLLRAGVELSQGLGRRELIARAASSLGILVSRRGELQQAEGLYQQSLKTSEDLGDRSGVAACLGNLGVLARDRGELQQAEGLYQQSLKICEELGDRSGVATCLGNLGVLARGRGELQEAERLYRQSLKICEELGDRSGVARCLGNLGNLARGRGELQEAERLYRQSLKIREELGDRSGLAICLGNLGNLAGDRGELQEAERLYRQSLKIRQELGDRSGVAICLGNLGNLARGRGELQEAERLYRQSLKICEELGDRSGVAACLVNLGSLAGDRGELQEAEGLYRQSLKIREELGDRSGVAACLGNLGSLAGGRGELQEAERLYRQSLKIDEELRNRCGVAVSLHQMGRLAHDCGRLDESERLYRESLAILEELNDRLRVAISLQQLGRLAHDRGHLEEAERLLRGGLKTFEALGTRLKIAESLRLLGRLAYEKNRLEEAGDLCRKGLQLAQEAGCRPLQVKCLLDLGAVAQACGQLDQAETLCQSSLQLSEQLEDALGTATALHQLGELALERGDATAAEASFQRSLGISLPREAARHVLWTYGGLMRAARVQDDAPKLRHYHDQGSAFAASRGPEAEAYWHEVLESPPGRAPSRP